MTPRTIPIIAFTGPSLGGKSTAAKYLKSRYGARIERIRFADPLKAMLRGFLETVGIDTDTIERMIEGDLKEVPSEHLGGRSPRHAMRTLGTEWGREDMGDALWVDAWAGRTRRAVGIGQTVVVEDLRFANEADKIKEHGGYIVALLGRGNFAGGHASENGEAVDKADRVFVNKGELADLYAFLDRLWADLSWARAANDNEPMRVAA
jgi:hypothetical protein